MSSTIPPIELGVWAWEPGLSVGPFRFGADAADIIRELDLERLEPDCALADWETYLIPRSESRVYVRDGKIEDVGCWDSLLFGGLELLDREREFVRMLLGPEDEADEILPDYVRAVYAELGLTLWYDGSHVASASCGPPYDVTHDPDRPEPGGD